MSASSQATRRVCILLLSFAGIAAAGCVAPGQRLLHGRIELDGEPLLTGMLGVSDSLRPNQAWTRLKDVSFEPTEAFAAHLPAQMPTQGNTRLKGRLRIVLEHTGRPFATVDTMQLDLIADPSQPGHWQVAPAEVDRTAPHVH